MKLSELIKKDVPKELWDQLLTAMGDDKDFDVVPRTRLNEVIEQRDKAKEEVTTYKAKADKHDELSTQITDLTGKLTAADTKYKDDLAAKDKEIGTMKADFTIKEKLTTNKVKNLTAVQALLNKEALKDDLSGLDGEIERIKKSDPYLFGDTVPGGTGKDGGDPNNQNQPPASTGGVSGLAASLSEAYKGQ